MNQYITLLFSLLAEFFLPPRTQPPGAGDRPPRSPACPRAWSQRGAGFTGLSRLARLEADDCSSGSPDSERRMAGRTSSWPVARGPVPRDRSLSENRTPTKAVFRADRRMARDRPSPYGKRHAFFIRSAGACPPQSEDPRKKRTKPQAVFPIEARRGTGPRPTVKGRRPCKP